MIEKLKKELSIEDFMCDGTDLRHYTFPNEERFMDKLNEIIDHLNTQEEKELEIGCPNCDERMSVSTDNDGNPIVVRGWSTASNQSNTEPTYDYYDNANNIHTTGKTVSEAINKGVEERTRQRLLKGSSTNVLPQKIKLLKDRAGYPAGEYHLLGVGYNFRHATEKVWGFTIIHPDIIKATSGQGIRSEVTDGEESVSRPIEKQCSVCRKGRIENEDGIDEECPKCTPQTEPIEKKCKSCEGKGRVKDLRVSAGETHYDSKMLSKVDCLDCKGAGVPPPLESKYEESIRSPDCIQSTLTNCDCIDCVKYRRELVESKYEDFGKELLEHLYKTGHENRHVVGILIDQIHKALE